MDWGVWSRKLINGLLTAAVLGALTALAVSVSGLEQQMRNGGKDVPLWVALVTPGVLHLIGQAQNWLKHRGG